MKNLNKVKFKVGDLVIVDGYEQGIIVSVNYEEYFCYKVKVSGCEYFCIEDSLKSPN